MTTILSDRMTRYLRADVQGMQQIDSVQILNPFLVGPEVLDEPSPTPP